MQLLVTGCTRTFPLRPNCISAFRSLFRFETLTPYRNNTTRTIYAMNNTKPTNAMRKRDRSTSPPSTPSPPPADQPTIPSILPADFYACYNQNDGHLTDIYGYFTPGPKTWRMAPHHFNPIPAALDPEAYAALLQRNQDESQINKHALHIWIEFGIDTVYTDPKERHAIQL